MLETIRPSNKYTGSLVGGELGGARWEGTKEWQRGGVHNTVGGGEGINNELQCTLVFFAST